MKGATVEALRIRKTVENDGEVHITGLPCHRGEKVEMILIIGSVEHPPKRQLTARDLRQSGLVGLWSHRKDIRNGSTFARRLRQVAQKRVS